MTMKVQFDVEEVAIKDLRKAVEAVPGIEAKAVTFHNSRETKGALDKPKPVAAVAK